MHIYIYTIVRRNLVGFTVKKEILLQMLPCVYAQNIMYMMKRLLYSL